MDMFEVRVEKEFSAAHHLLNYQGKCENPHGHNFVVRVWARGEQLDAANMLVDYQIMKKALKTIINEMDHRDLNVVFEGESPSSEFLARYIYHRMKAEIPQVYQTCVYETPTSVAYYYE